MSVVTGAEGGDAIKARGAPSPVAASPGAVSAGGLDRVAGYGRLGHRRRGCRRLGRPEKTATDLRRQPVPDATGQAMPMVRFHERFLEFGAQSPGPSTYAVCVDLWGTMRRLVVLLIDLLLIAAATMASNT